MTTITDCVGRNRETAATFRRLLDTLQIRWRDALERREAPDERDRERSRFYEDCVKQYDPDWHYITLGESTTVDEQMRAEGRGVFNGCTGVWLSEVYGPTLERDNLMSCWRLPYADWILHEARRLGMLS